MVTNISNQSRALPRANQNRVLPRQNRALPKTRQNRALPKTSQNRALPETSQNRALPDTSQSRILPNNNVDIDKVITTLKERGLLADKRDADVDIDKVITTLKERGLLADKRDADVDIDKVITTLKERGLLVDSEVAYNLGRHGHNRRRNDTDVDINKIITALKERGLLADRKNVVVDVDVDKIIATLKERGLLADKRDTDVDVDKIIATLKEKGLLVDRKDNDSININGGVNVTKNLNVGNNIVVGNHIIDGNSQRCMVVGDNGVIENQNNICLFTHGSKFVPEGDGKFYIKNEGGTYIYSNDSATSGVVLQAGSSSWASISDINQKENITEVDYLDVYEKVKMLPIYNYNYRGNPKEHKNIGPVSQDWYTLFPSEKIKIAVKEGEEIKFVEKPSKNVLTIEFMDMIGICFSTIKVLSEKVACLENENRFKE